MDYQIRCEDNRADWVRVRTEVFIEEQGFQEEFDDQDASATHLTLYTPLGELVGCGRFFETEPGVYRLGRIAVLPKFRGQGAGRAIVLEMEQLARDRGARRADVDAQVRAMEFYHGLGYTEHGEQHMDEHVPHIDMSKAL